jgi:hypothetical protein
MAQWGQLWHQLWSVVIKGYDVGCTCDTVVASMEVAPRAKHQGDSCGLQ